MMQREGADDDIADANGLYRFLVPKTRAGICNWIIRRPHLVCEDAFEVHWLGARMNGRGRIRMLHGSEKRNALDVVPMEVRQEEMERRVVRESVAQGADPRAGVEDKQGLIGIADAQAGCVSTVAEVFGNRSRDGSANAPKRQIERHRRQV